MRNSIALIILLLWCPLLLSATDVRSGDQVTITNPVEGDLYLGAGTITIEAPIHGDLIAAARICHIRDTIREDAVVMAQELFLEAPVLDDARLMAATLHIRADVMGDVFTGGGTVYIDPGVTIHGDLYAGGGTVHLNGRVLGKIELAGGEVFFEGTAEQAAAIKAGRLIAGGTFRGPARLAAEQLEVTTSAKFYDDLRYWSEAGTIDLGPNLLNGAEARFDETLKTEINDNRWGKFLGVGSAVFVIGRLLSAALVMLILTWGFRHFFRRTAQRLIGNYATSLGYGMLYLLGVPLLIVLALVSIIGIPAGIFSLATYGLSLGFAHILTALLVAYWWQEANDLHWRKGQTLLIAMSVFVVLKLISWIPFVGWLISLAAIATTFGAILAELLHKKQGPAEVTPVDPADVMTV